MHIKWYFDIQRMLVVDVDGSEFWITIWVAPNCISALYCIELHHNYISYIVIVLPSRSLPIVVSKTHRSRLLKHCAK